MDVLMQMCSDGISPDGQLFTKIRTEKFNKQPDICKAAPPSYVTPCLAQDLGPGFVREWFRVRWARWDKVLL